WIERWPPEPKARGSNPLPRTTRLPSSPHPPPAAWYAPTSSPRRAGAGQGLGRPRVDPHAGRGDAPLGRQLHLRLGAPPRSPAAGARLRHGRAAARRTAAGRGRARARSALHAPAPRPRLRAAVLPAGVRPGLPPAPRGARALGRRGPRAHRAVPRRRPPPDPPRRSPGPDLVPRGGIRRALRGGRLRGARHGVEPPGRGA